MPIIKCFKMAHSSPATRLIVGKAFPFSNFIKRYKGIINRLNGITLCDRISRKSLCTSLFYIAFILKVTEMENESMTDFSPPPRIKYSSRPPYYRQMIKDATKNIRLSARASKLLTYYCNQANGFSPALKLIERETGIAPNKASEIRQELVRKGVLWYDAGERVVFIDWERLRFLAMLEMPLGKSESKHGFSPVSTIKPREKKKEKRIREIIAEMKPTPLQRLTECLKAYVPPIDKLPLYDALEDMTEDEYTA